MTQMSELQNGLGMPGGFRNPLGSRAMYLWQDNKDTLYSIHGTVEPWTKGTSVSSGCIRMINQDVIDLYQRTPVGGPLDKITTFLSHEFCVRLLNHADACPAVVCDDVKRHI